MESAELSRVPLFARLTEEERIRLAAKMRTLSFEEGAVMVEQGDLPFEFFVILDGTATVERSGRHLADLGPGEFFGEQGIIEKRRRNAEVTATSPVRAGVLAGWDLSDLLEAFPKVRFEIERTIAAYDAKGDGPES